MEDDQEICRVCRCESTQEHPLYHPCKCSGSIRFVHQDCLLEWLSHSRKKYCELCEYPFMFTPIYREDMPERIPIGVVIRQCAKRTAFLLRAGVRAILVAFVWLVILPYLTLWIWRFYFWTGEGMRFSKGLTRNDTMSSQELADASALNGTESATAEMAPGFNLKGFLSDCFEGQIITAFVIVVFVAAYLFREWVLQNTPAETGIEMDADDNDEPAEPPRIVNPVDGGRLVQQQNAVDIMLNVAQRLEPPNEAAAREQEQSIAALQGVRRELQRGNRFGTQNNQSPPDYQTTAQRNFVFSESSFSGSEAPYDTGSYALLSGDSSYAYDRTTHGFQDLGSPSASNLGDMMSDSEEHLDHFNDVPSVSDSEEYDDDNDRRIHGNGSEGSTSSRTRGAPEFAASPELGGPSGFHHDIAELHRLEQGNHNPQGAVNIPWGHQEQEPAMNQWEDRNDIREPAIDDEEPFDLAEDIEGVLEAIGMRGNPWMLLQNSVLMVVMITLCLGVAIWIPYVLGRLIILIQLVNVVKFIINILRLVTDPVVDFTLDYGVPYVFDKIALTFTLIPGSYREWIHSAGRTVVDGAERMFHFAPESQHIQTMIPSGVATENGFPWNEYATNIQHLLESGSIAISNRWHQFALGQTGLDRSVCIVMGYLVIVSLGSWYLAKGRATPRPTGNGFNDIILQQGVFLKVFFFVLLELVVFPAVCGVLLDLATLPLFGDATIMTRWAFFKANPYSAAFLHWFIGTGFMFHFAVFITLCREILRSGVMWFIRDPNDPQFHPVQEIIERPLLNLLQKIGSSALMYSGMIVIGVGAVTFAVSRFAGIYPLRCGLDQTLSTLALDLLCVHFLVPPLIGYIQPRERTKSLISSWWRTTSRQLRLTSFMFNGRYPEEEGTHVRRTYKAWILRQKAPIPSDVYADVAIDENDETAPVVFRRDGHLARVPKHDTVPVIDGRRMIVPVDPVTLEALDPVERDLGHPAASESGDQENNTCIVYIPPRFKMRILIFVGLIWLSGSALACSVTVLPLHLGRIIFDRYLAPGVQVHDMYSYMTGMYLLVFLSAAAGFVRRKYNAWHQNGQAPNWANVFAWIKSKGQRALKALYVASVAGFVIPLLFGVAVDLYIFMPIRFSNSSDALVVNLSEDWSFGIVYLGIAYGIAYQLPANAVQRQLDEIHATGILNYGTWAMTKYPILPVVACATVAILVPGLLAAGIIRVLGIADPSMQVMLFRCAYPIIFCLGILTGVCALSTRLLRLWLKTVRDDTYLVGKRLHNLDETTAESTRGNAASA